MTILEMLGTGGGIVLVAMTLIQLAPVKIDPWGAVARAIGRAINKEVLDKVEKLADDVKELRTDRDTDKAEGYRTQILRFGDEILHGVPHSKEHFDQILKNIAKYDAYCDTHTDFENGVTHETSRRILEIYHERLEKNDFL